MVPLSARPTLDAKYLNAKFENPDILKQMKEEAEKRWAKRLAEDTEFEEIEQRAYVDPLDKSKMDIEKQEPEDDTI